MVSELEIVSAQLDEELEKSKINLCNGMFFQHEIEKVPVKCLYLWLRRECLAIDVDIRKIENGIFQKEVKKFWKLSWETKGTNIESPVSVYGKKHNGNITMCFMGETICDWSIARYGRDTGNLLKKINQQNYFNFINESHDIFDIKCVRRDIIELLVKYNMLYNIKDGWHSPDISDRIMEVL